MNLPAPAADPTGNSNHGITQSVRSSSVRGSRFRWLRYALPAAALVAGGGAWVLSHGEADPLPLEPTDATRIEGRSIRFSKAFAERAKLRLARVESARLVPVVTAVGTIDFDPEHVAAVGARLRGLVTRVSKFEGDTVDSGTVLAVIESAELGEAQATVSLLEAEKEAADLNLTRETALAERRLSTAREAEIASVEAQRYEHLLGAARQKVSALAGGTGHRSTRLGAHELRSPLKGTVVERSVAPGQAVDGELVAFRVANTEHLWVELEVFEKSLGLIRLGDRVELSPLAAPEQAFEGRVTRVGAVIDPETRSAPVRVEVRNLDAALRAGQAVNARIHGSAGDGHSSILVPTTAVTFVDGKPTVFLASGDGAVEVATVELGFSNGTQTEVTSGVAAGQNVVSEGVFALKSELFR